jgi:uncharacterized protein (DUF433 family)
MKLEIHDDPAPLRIDEAGAVRIGPSRVTLNTVIYEFETGATAEEIVLDYDTLSLADVYATIGYYLRHRTGVDDYLKQLRQEEDRLYAEARAEQDRLGIRERLEERRRKMAESG